MAENIPIRPRRGRDRRPAVVDEPSPPATLSPRSRELWTAIVREWVLDVASLPVLEGGLLQLDTHDTAMVQLRRDGLVLINPSGVPRPNPCAAIARESLGAYRLAMRHLGLEPEGIR